MRLVIQQHIECQLLSLTLAEQPTYNMLLSGLLRKITFYATSAINIQKNHEVKC
jgi:hypothetical protein